MNNCLSAIEAITKLLFCLNQFQKELMSALFLGMTILIQWLMLSQFMNITFVINLFDRAFGKDG